MPRHVHGRKVRRIVCYFDGERLRAAVGLAPKADAQRRQSMGQRALQESHSAGYIGRETQGG
jgi:hypothetical protein